MTATRMMCKFGDVQICRCKSRVLVCAVITSLIVTSSSNDGIPEASMLDKIPQAPGQLLSSVIEKTAYVQPESDYHRLVLMDIDTSTINGKILHIKRDFRLNNMLSESDSDTLFDLNFDGHDDIIIPFYGSSGTGIKNRIEVHLFDPKLNCFHFSQQFSDLPNPSFYISEKKVTSFYLAHGCGYGTQLEWINNMWISTKEFSVCNQEEKSDWEITFPLRRDTIHIVRPYQMIPPQDILQTNIEF